MRDGMRGVRDLLTIFSMILFRKTIFSTQYQIYILLNVSDEDILY